MEKISLLRDLRATAAADRSKQLHTRTLVVELPKLVRAVAARPNDERPEVSEAATRALSRIAQGLAYVSPASQETLLLEACARTGVLKATVRCCFRAECSEEALLLGLTVLSNTAFLKCTGLLLEASAPKLLYRLLCREETGEAANAYAAAALRHLTSEPSGAAAFDRPQRRTLLAALRTLAGTEDLVARGYVLGAVANLNREVASTSQMQQQLSPVQKRSPTQKPQQLRLSPSAQLLSSTVAAARSYPADGASTSLGAPASSTSPAALGGETAGSATGAAAAAADTAATDTAASAEPEPEDESVVAARRAASDAEAAVASAAARQASRRAELDGVEGRRAALDEAAKKVRVAAAKAAADARSAGSGKAVADAKKAADDAAAENIRAMEALRAAATEAGELRADVDRGDAALRALERRANDGRAALEVALVAAAKPKRRPKPPPPPKAPKRHLARFHGRESAARAQRRAQRQARLRREARQQAARAAKEEAAMDEVGVSRRHEAATRLAAAARGKQARREARAPLRALHGHGHGRGHGHGHAAGDAEAQRSGRADVAGLLALAQHERELARARRVDRQQAEELQAALALAARSVRPARRPVRDGGGGVVVTAGAADGGAGAPRRERRAARQARQAPPPPPPPKPQQTQRRVEAASAVIGAYIMGGQASCVMVRDALQRQAGVTQGNELQLHLQQQRARVRPSEGDDFGGGGRGSPPSPQLRGSASSPSLPPVDGASALHADAVGPSPTPAAERRWAEAGASRSDQLRKGVGGGGGGSGGVRARPDAAARPEGLRKQRQYRADPSAVALRASASETAFRRAGGGGDGVRARMPTMELVTTGSYDSLVKARHGLVGPPRVAPDSIIREPDSHGPPRAHPSTLPRIAPTGSLPRLRRGPNDLTAGE